MGSRTSVRASPHGSRGSRTPSPAWERRTEIEHAARRGSNGSRRISTRPWRGRAVTRRRRRHGFDGPGIAACFGTAAASSSRTRTKRGLSGGLRSRLQARLATSAARCASRGREETVRIGRAVGELRRRRGHRPPPLPCRGGGGGRGPAVQELELDDEEDADDLAAELLDELALRRVPPVASTSSWTRTRWPVPIASACSSSASKPYSSAYFGAHRPPRQLPGLARGDEAAAEPHASAPPVMKPRASAPRTMSGFRGSPTRRARRPSPAAPPGREQRHDVLEDDPGLGEVRDVADHRGEVERSRVTERDLRCLRRTRARRGAARAPAASSPSVCRSSTPACRRSGFRARSAGATTASSRPCLAVGRCGTPAGAAARSRSARAAPHAARSSTSVSVEPLAALARGASSPKSSSSRSARAERRALAELVEPTSSSRPGEPRGPALRSLRARPRRAPGGSRAAAGTRPAGARGSPQPLDVLLAEEPVAALRAPRRQQPLVLEVADLRDRDVRELGLQPPADGADRQQPLRGRGRSLRCRRGRHRARKVSRYLPIWTSSPSASRCASRSGAG